MAAIDGSTSHFPKYFWFFRKITLPRDYYLLEATEPHTMQSVLDKYRVER
jgi:hypothetical protein